MTKKKTKYSSYNYDWKNNKKLEGFPYKSIEDPKYLKDRSKLFQENGNGWWWGQPKSKEEEEDADT